MREKVKELVAAEDPAAPLSDEALVEALKAAGHGVARRTVAKYRGELRDPELVQAPATRLIRRAGARYRLRHAMLRNVRIEVSYDGSLFYGWQRQDGFDSVQAAIEDGLAELLDTVVVIHGAGRTDTGVHGLRQVAHFHVDTRLDDDRLKHALNAHLPPGVVVRAAETCADDFHARFDARGKRYGYLVQTTRHRPRHRPAVRALGAGGARLRRRMRAAASRMVGEKDFAAFGNTGSPRRTTVRRVTHVRIVPRRERFAVVVQGNGFLYNMVRTMAGTLLAVGKGRMTPDDVSAALERARPQACRADRARARPRARAGALRRADVRSARAAEPRRDTARQGAGPGPRARSGGRSATRIQERNCSSFRVETAFVPASAPADALPLTGTPCCRRVRRARRRSARARQLDLPVRLPRR